jgi:hypothetical protein
MANYAREQGLDVDEVRKAGEAVREMSSAYRELAIDVGLAAGGAIPGYGAADAVSLGRSISKGDGWGIVFDLIGFVPLLGDAAKGGKVLDKYLAVRRVLDQTLTGLSRVFRKTEDTAADFWRARRNSDAYNEALKSCSTTKCYNDAARLKGPQYGKTPVSRGQWQPPTSRGDGRWIPDDGTELRAYLDSLDPPRTGIDFENGFPKFDDFSQADVKIPMTGSHAKDFDIADDLYRKQIDDPDWQRPEGMTWHHKEDGTTMQLVPSALNNNVRHMGGAALFKEGKPVGDDF